MKNHHAEAKLRLQTLTISYITVSLTDTHPGERPVFGRCTVRSGAINAKLAMDNIVLFRSIEYKDMELQTFRNWASSAETESEALSLFHLVAMPSRSIGPKGPPFPARCFDI